MQTLSGRTPAKMAGSKPRACPAKNLSAATMTLAFLWNTAAARMLTVLASFQTLRRYSSARSDTARLAVRTCSSSTIVWRNDCTARLSWSALRFLLAVLMSVTMWRKSSCRRVLSLTRKRRKKMGTSVAVCVVNEGVEWGDGCETLTRQRVGC